MKGYLGIVVITVLCIACGGGSGSHTSPTTGSSGNPWSGDYVGGFEDLYGNVGSFSMTVSAAGLVSGSFGAASGGSAIGTPPSGAFSGELNGGGLGDIMVDGGELEIELGVAKQSTLSARLLAGTVFEYWSTSITNPTGKYGGANPFAGQYTGAVYYPNLKLTAAVSVVVGSNGSMSGLESFDLASGNFAIGQISGTLGSSGSLQYTVGPIDGEKDTTPETLSGTVKLSSGSVSGALSDSNGDSPTLTLSQVS